MTELEKIEYAKSFIDKLANGINPLDGTQIPDSDVVNNVRLSRCFFYVSDILRQVIENGSIRPHYPERIKKQAFALTDEQRDLLRPLNRAVSVSDIAKRLNSLVDLNEMAKIQSTAINSWLTQIGLLETAVRSDGKKFKRPSASGAEMGIITEERMGQFGAYTVTLFSPAAQQFVFDNIDAIVAYQKEKNSL